MTDLFKTHDEICSEYGIDRLKMFGWETGVLAPEISEICRLTEYFRISQDYLTWQEFEHVMAEAEEMVKLAEMARRSENMSLFETIVALPEDAIPELLEILENKLKQEGWIEKKRG
ncbi:MAG: hypothetical protein ACI4KE_04160 [Anaerovoracaceae bacterium]